MLVRHDEVAVTAREPDLRSEILHRVDRHDFLPIVKVLLRLDVCRWLTEFLRPAPALEARRRRHLSCAGRRWPSKSPCICSVPER